MLLDYIFIVLIYVLNLPRFIPIIVHDYLTNYADDRVQRQELHQHLREDYLDHLYYYRHTEWLELTGGNSHAKM